MKSGLFIVVCCLWSSSLQAAEIFPADAQVELLWNEGAFTEGVAAAHDGQIYFSDITDGTVPGRILRFDPKTGQTAVHAADSGQSNGLMFDAAGRLLAVCGANNGRRSVAVVAADGTLQDLVTTIDGRKFNAPNDLVIHPRGDIYFSDPRYVGPEPVELDLMWVFRFQPESGRIERATAVATKPNGVILAPDGNTLYIAETNNGSPVFGERAAKPRMALIACPVGEDGGLGEGKLLVEFDPAGGIDGMTVDREGRIYTAFRNPGRFGVLVLSPQGEELAFLPTPELPTNCCFGRGSEAHVLYVTAGKGLYRVSTKAVGFHTTGP